MLLELRDCTVMLGGKTVLDHLDFAVRGTERIALVGRNGAGKTTLLRLLLGELEPERDDKNPGAGRFTARAVRIGMLSQQPAGDPDCLLADFLKKAETGPAQDERAQAQRQAEVDRMLTGFGFPLTDKEKRLREFSGGEQTRLALIALLLSEPDILLLDEPTNHLDEEVVEWLEEVLIHYPKAVVMVSHDRYFLDQTAEVVYELEDGRAFRYAGNYSAYRQQKTASLRRRLQAYERQQEEIRRLNDLIERFRHKPRKAAFARSRKKILERMELIEKPREDTARIYVGEIVPASRCSKWPVETEKVKIGYDHALAELTLRVRRGQKLGVLGPNGAGKTTFLKTVAGRLSPLSGKLSLGNGVEAAYFDQQSAAIGDPASVKDWFLARYPALTEKELRSTLAAWLFTGRDLGKRVCDLSGGEKSRLVLVSLLFAKPNLLLLDEPTNHMDIPARETVESILAAYTGTLILISHDRYLIDRIADSLLIFGGEGDPVLYYPFSYRHFRERKNLSKSLTDLSAVRSAKEQAMIDGLKAVPRGSHRMRELSAEAVWEDWQFRLCREELEEAEKRAETAWQRTFTEEGWLQPEAAGEREAAWEKWTAACLHWYDLWLSVHPETPDLTESEDLRLTNNSLM